MYKNILIATDGSELAAKVVAQGLGLAKAIGARTTAIMVTESWAMMAPPQVVVLPMVQEYERAVAAHTEKILSAVEEAAKKINVVCSTEHVRDRLPADGILEAAKSSGCDLIVMASLLYQGRAQPCGHDGREPRKTETCLPQGGDDHGNAPGLNSGAAAMIVADAGWAEKQGRGNRRGPDDAALTFDAARQHQAGHRYALHRRRAGDRACFGSNDLTNTQWR